MDGVRLALVPGHFGEQPVVHVEVVVDRLVPAPVDRLGEAIADKVERVIGLAVERRAGSVVDLARPAARLVIRPSR